MSDFTDDIVNGVLNQDGEFNGELPINPNVNWCDGCDPDNCSGCQTSLPSQGTQGE